MRLEQIRTNVDERGRTRTDVDERGRTRTDADEHGRIQTNANERRRTQMNVRQTASGVWADATSRRFQMLDVCSRTFGTYYITVSQYILGTESKI